MSRERLDVGFVPAECPGADGPGATRTSSLLVERLSRRHDLTVYVATQMSATGVDLPAEERVEYVMHDELASLPHPTLNKVEALREEEEALEGHDLVHAYSPAFIPVLADLDVPTLSTLNSYLPVCPKGDLLYHDETKCRGPSTGKCVGCIARSNVDRRQSPGASLRATYSALGKLGFVQRAMAAADDVTAYQALSPHIRSDYDELGFPGNRITVVPHFYEESFHDPTGNATLDDPVELLFVGRLKANKGPQVLVRALAVLRERGHDVRLRVAGSGPHEGSLEQLAADCGVDDRIEWLGHVDHSRLVEEYRAADVFVYPGLLDEPFGRVLLEALGMRTPVLASDVGSTDYIVGDGGVRFAPGDETALADAYERIVANYADHFDAIPTHLERFAPGRVEDAFCDLYAETAATGRETAPIQR